MAFLVSDLQIPYYAVIFSSTRRSTEGYQEMADKMNSLASKQRGFLGVEKASNNDGSITVSYWKSLDDIRAWKQDVEHLVAQKQGRNKWYDGYQVRVCKVERGYGYKSRL